MDSIKGIPHSPPNMLSAGKGPGAKKGDFLETLESTPMTRSYKMLVLWALLNRDAIPGRITIDQLTEEFGRIARRSARFRKDVGKA